MGGMLEGVGVPGGGGQKENKWDNSKSIISKIYLIEKKEKNVPIVPVSSENIRG